MKRTTNLLFAILLWLVSSTPVMTQTVNTNRFISINVVNGQQIKLDFAADQVATPVKIVSGSGEYNLTVGTSWVGTQKYLADDSVMTVYGDITKFDCSGNYNNVTGIDLSHNTIITWFSCGKNSLQDLIVSSNKALKELYCYNNSIKTLNLDSTTELTKLSCARNSISSLDLSHNKKLKWLNCSDNRLTGLDVSSNILLEKIICHKNNSLSTQALDLLYCSLPDRTGTFSGYIEPIYDDSSPNDSVVLATNSQNALDKNWKVKYAFDDTDIPATTGNYVCNSNVNMSRYVTLTVAQDSDIRLDFKADANGTPVKIKSDSTERNITVGLGWYDGNYLYSNFSVTATSPSITIFGDISALRCGENGANLTAIDLSNNTQLTYLDCTNDSIHNLDISNNTQLTALYCYNNKLSSLDVTHNTQLIELGCDKNFLTTLDVTRNTQLMYLYCNKNFLTTHDVTHNSQLIDLSCSRNSLTTLDVSRNIQLTYLNCGSNSLTSLDIRANTLLDKLYCYNNSFTSQILDNIYCQLPDRTGKEKGKIAPIYKPSSPDSTIVLATNKNIAINKNWRVQYLFPSGKDIPATTGSYACTTLHDSVNMDSYITLTVADGAYIYLDFKAAADNTHIRIVSGSNIQNITIGTDWLSLASYIADGAEMKIYGDVTVLDCRNNGANIQALDVTKNTALTELYCHRNQLTALDVSKNTALTVLYCHRNQLTALDVTKNTALTTLYCYENQLTALDITKNTALITLYCNENQLTALDVTKNTALTTLSCYNNQITALDITKDTVLKILYCNENRITTLDVTKNTALTELYCHKNQLTALDVSKNTNLVTLYCNENQLTSLDISKNTALTTLGCYNNQITALDITKDTVLTTLYCNENQLTTLDVTKNIALTKLYCYKNQLTALDVTKNIALTELYCYENRFTTLDVTKNTALEVLGCYNNQIKALDVTKNTTLTKLYCYNNPQLNSLNIVGNNAIKNIYIYGCNFSACGLDSIFRDLPQCLPTDSAKILIKSNASTNPGTDGCRDTIASHRNWAVLNFKGNNSMDTIKNSFYTCVPNLNLNRAIRLGVVSGQTISAAIKAAANNTHIRVISGATDTILTIGLSLKSLQLPARADSMVFFGDITRFNCSMNGNNITAISTKTNPILEELQCIGNAISTLDLSHNVELSELYCLGNQLTSLDLSHNHKLTKLACYDNPQLQHIDVNGCYPLSRVVVYGCNLSDCGLDSLLRALPRRSSDNKGKIFIKDGTSTNPGSGGCQDTIASHKNWVVLDYNGGSPDTIANTHYTCADTPTDNDRHPTNETDIKIYPNPVADILYLSATARTIHIYDIYGIEVARATDTDKVGVSHLPDGVYIVRADGAVAKMVKQ